MGFDRLAVIGILTLLIAGWSRRFSVPVVAGRLVVVRQGGQGPGRGPVVFRIPATDENKSLNVRAARNAEERGRRIIT